MSLLENHVNILFTSVGRRVELLRLFRAAYESLALSGNITAIDIDPLAPALQVADRPYIVPRLTAPEYISTLARICKKEQVHFVFPLIDPDIGVLAHNRGFLEVNGTKLVVIPAKSVPIAADKWQTYKFFQQLGISTPRSWLPQQLDPKHLEFPVFIKPRRGSAAKFTFKAHDLKEYAFFIDYVPDPIVQEYVSGQEITNDVICDLSGEILGIASRQRIEVRWGEVAKGITVYNPKIAADCIRIAEALPAVGPITVQCIIRDDNPYFIEINARLGGGLPLAIAAGVDAPRWLLAKFAGIPIDIPPFGNYQTGLYISRFDDSNFLTEATYEQMASRHI